MVTNIRRWSQTATGNASVAGGANTINFSEGQAPSTVNNSAREAMAQIRGWYTAAEASWIEQSNTASIASQTVFKLSGDQTANWTANRRWRLRGGSTVRYGSVVSSSYTAETTITVTVDSGSLSASHSIAALASITADHIPANTYVTSASLATSLATYIQSASLATALAPYMTSNSSSIAIAAAIAPYITSNSASAAIATAVAAAGSTTLYDSAINQAGATKVLDNTVITAAYTRLVLMLFNIGTDDNSQTASVAISGNNGSAYGAEVDVLTLSSNAFSYSGVVTIDNAKVTSGSRAISFIGNSATVGITVQSITTGYINALRITVGDGPIDAGGRAVLIGYK